MSITITSEKFSIVRHIKLQGKIDIGDFGAVIKEARLVWGTALTSEECQYIYSHYDYLEKEFKVRKEV